MHAQSPPNYVGLTHARPNDTSEMHNKPERVGDMQCGSLHSSIHWITNVVVIHVGLVYNYHIAPNLRGA